MRRIPRNRNAARRRRPAGRALLLAAGLTAWIVALGAWLDPADARAAAADGVGGAPPPATVVVISLDGTRPADLRPDDVPTLAALAARGASAEALVPVFPTNTFPNHVTLMTGVAPDRHGIVGNHFIDPERGDFDRDAIPSFIEVEPLWSLLEGRGVVTASYYWVGSEGPWRSGRGPHFWRPFDSSTSEKRKVEQILAWLDLRDPAERPRLVTSWFHGADKAGHDHGPGSAAVRAALRSQDRAIADLVSGIEQRGLGGSTTLLFVSDHGMTKRGRPVDLNRALRKAGVRARVLGAGGFASVYLASPSDAVRAIAAARALGLEAWTRSDAPAALRVDNPRFGDVIAVAPEDVTIVNGGPLAGRTLGWHGYLPDLPSMAGILVAAGPGIAPGTRLGRVANLDVAPTVLAWLGQEPPAWMEGHVIDQLVTAGPKGAKP